MKLDNFLNEILGNLLTQEKLDLIKSNIKDGMLECGFDFDTTKVESQVFDNEKNYEPRVEISSEGYDDGEIIFIDYHLD